VIDVGTAGDEGVEFIGAKLDGGRDVVLEILIEFTELLPGPIEGVVATVEGGNGGRSGRGERQDLGIAIVTEGADASEEKQNEQGEDETATAEAAESTLLFYNNNSGRCVSHGGSGLPEIEKSRKGKSGAKRYSCLKLFAPGRVGGDELHGPGKKDPPGKLVGPRRCAGGVRQRDEIKAVSGMGAGIGGADDGVEFVAGNELLNGELADGDNEGGMKDFHFGLHPISAIQDFISVGNAIAAGGFFTGEAAADGGHVDVGAEGGFIHAGMFVEPAEEFFTGGPGERTAHDGFLVAGGLTNEHDRAKDGASADDGRIHARTATATAERGDVAVEPALGFRRSHADREIQGRWPPGRR